MHPQLKIKILQTNLANVRTQKKKTPTSKPKYDSIQLKCNDIVLLYNIIVCLLDAKAKGRLKIVLI